jgi:hypothetical protein
MPNATKPTVPAKSLFIVFSPGPSLLAIHLKRQMQLATADNFAAEIRLIPIPPTTYTIGPQDCVSLVQQPAFQI